MITRVLIANRGEIACRIARTARRMGLATVAVYSSADEHALHVEAADEAVPIGGAAAADSYLRVEAILAAARATGADAVHPGYGFLAESATAAAAVAGAGLTWVGPPADVIAAMGDKLAAKERVRAAGVPVLQTMEPDAVPAAAYPVVVKAAAGGGGKGMRVVDAPAGLPDAVTLCRREAAAAFGDDRIFVEPYVSCPRHVEVQVLGDHHGNLVHLGERDCSVQRRHQKVIESSPAPGLDPALRERLHAAALRAAAVIGYTNAGTVEFVVWGEDRFAFLEVNTRLQVEHPVTELSWRLRDGGALDLVRLQLAVAAGELLPFSQDDVIADGHAVEARLYAEDPQAGYLPSSGVLECFHVPTLDGVRVDAGVRAGDVVSVHYDPLLAKLVSRAPTRREAVALLAQALAASRVHGVRTNRDLLVRTLRHPAFTEGPVDTGFLDREGLAVPPPPHPLRALVHGAAAALTDARRRQRQRGILPDVPLGWRNNPGTPTATTFEGEGGSRTTVTWGATGDGVFTVHAADLEEAVHVLAWPDERHDEALDLALGGRRWRVHVTLLDGDRFAVDSPLGSDTLTVRGAGTAPDAAAGADTVRAPMPATVASVTAAPGVVVRAGEVLAVLEAMKMHHPVAAPRAGVVAEVRITAGQQVDRGEVLAVIADEPPAADQAPGR